jgi:hypothetical protein
MMHGNRRNTEAAQRFAARRQREDEAPRLSTEIPNLASLRLEIEERAGGSVVAEPKHIRRVVIDSAPALFVLSCGDARCKDGGHDVTSSILRALRSGDTTFEGEDVCNGSLGSGQCSRVLHYVGSATYNDNPPNPRR